MKEILQLDQSRRNLEGERVAPIRAQMGSARIQAEAGERSSCRQVEAAEQRRGGQGRGGGRYFRAVHH